MIFLEFWNFCSTQHRRASKEIFKLDLSSQFQCGHVQYSHVLHLPFQKVSEKRSLDYYMMRFWWLPINAVSDEKTLNFQLKSEKSIIQISSRGGMTEIFRHKIIIWIVCGKGIEIWCFSLYCVDVCKRLYCRIHLVLHCPGCRHHNLSLPQVFCPIVSNMIGRHQKSPRSTINNTSKVFLTREMRCLRHKIHLGLFSAFGLSAFNWILTLSWASLVVVALLVNVVVLML